MYIIDSQSLTTSFETPKNKLICRYGSGSGDGAVTQVAHFEWWPKHKAEEKGLLVQGRAPTMVDEKHDNLTVISRMLEKTLPIFLTYQSILLQFHLVL